MRDEVGIPAGKKALAGCPVSLHPVPVPVRPTMTTDTGKCPVARTGDSASLLGAELMAASALHIASASEWRARTDVLFVINKLKTLD